MVTMKDVAKATGVSRQSVSAVLGNKTYRYVSEKRRNEILAVAKELGYTPNLASKILRRLPTQTIGFITGVGEATWEILQTITVLARKRYDYSILVINPAGFHRENTKDMLTDFVNRGLDGMIVSSFAPLDEVRVIIGDQVPFCFLNSAGRGLEYISRNESDVFGIDMEYGGYAQSSHLARLGHRKIAYVGDVIGNKQKVEGFVRGLKENDLEMSDANIFNYRDSSSAIDVGNALIENHFTAVVASNDPIALSIIKSLRLNGARVPEDLAVIGYGNTQFCDSAIPSLTSIRHPFERLGESVIDGIVQKIQDRSPVPSQFFRPELIVRKSCGASVNERKKP